MGPFNNQMQYQWSGCLSNKPKSSSYQLDANQILLQWTHNKTIRCFIFYAFSKNIFINYIIKIEIYYDMIRLIKQHFNILNDNAHCVFGWFHFNVHYGYHFYQLFIIARNNIIMLFCSNYNKPMEWIILYLGCVSIVIEWLNDWMIV